MKRGGRPVALLARTINAGVSTVLRNARIGPHLGKAVTTISYVGRRSGRTFSTPVAYRRDGNRVTIVADVPDVKNCWRNFTGDGGPITLRLDGTDRTGHAVAHRTGRGWAIVTVTLDPESAKAPEPHRDGRSEMDAAKMSKTYTVTTRLATRMLRTRWFVRAPIWLFRVRLGFLLGHRLLMLEHVGRTSGLARYVALEVVARVGDEYTVAAGFGERAQWLRNLDAHPQAHISVGTRVRMPVVAHRLTEDQAADALRRYQATHPRAWAKLSPLFEQTLGEPVGESGAALPLVRFAPGDAA